MINWDSLISPNVRGFLYCGFVWAVGFILNEPKYLALPWYLQVIAPIGFAIPQQSTWYMVNHIRGWLNPDVLIFLEHTSVNALAAFIWVLIGYFTGISIGAQWLGTIILSFIAHYIVNKKQLKKKHDYQQNPM